MPETATTLADLFNDAALLSLEHRFHLGEVVGDSEWRVDLATSRFEFLGERALTCERLHLLGSAAPGPESWMWAWANPSAFPSELTHVSTQLRDHGERLGIPELSKPEVAFDTVPQAQGRPDMVALLLAEVAKPVSGHWMSYIFHAGRGTHLACLIEHPAFELPAPTPERTMSVIQQGVVEPSVSDPRRAVTSYAEWRGLGQRVRGDELTLTGPDFALTLDFDDQGTLSKINAAAHPEGNPSPDQSA